MTNTTNQQDSSAKAMADTVQRLQGEPAARMAKLSQDSSATSDEAPGYGYPLPFRHETDKHDIVRICDAEGGAVFELNTHTQRPLDDKEGLAQERAAAESFAAFIVDAVNALTTPAPQAATPLPEQDEQVERALFEATISKREQNHDAWRVWQAARALTQQAAPAAPIAWTTRANMEAFVSGKNSGLLIWKDNRDLGDVPIYASPVAAPEAPASEQAREIPMRESCDDPAMIGPDGSVGPCEACIRFATDCLSDDKPEASTASDPQSVDIASEILGIFQACGFEVRAPSEPGVSNPYAVCGSLDSAAILLETVMTGAGPDGQRDAVLDEVAASIKSAFRHEDRLDPDYIAQCILSHKDRAVSPAATTASTIGEGGPQPFSPMLDALVKQPTEQNKRTVLKAIENLAITAARRAPAPSREAAAGIEEWWKRIGCTWNPGASTGEEAARDAEIADLRAALAQQGATQAPANKEGGG